MKKELYIALMPLLVALIVSGCGKEIEPNTTETNIEQTETIEVKNKALEELKSESSNMQFTVGIKARIKEIQGNSILISSDIDEFPGAFSVDVPEKIIDISMLSGGDSILIQMQDLHSKDTQGLKKFSANQIVKQEQYSSVTKHDVLLTAAPPIVLSDILSSNLNSFELHSGSYSWSYKNGRELLDMVACGMAPLDKNNFLESKALDIPEYNGMDYVTYSLGCVISPDIFTIYEWDKNDIGNPNAKETSKAIFYYQPLLELKPNKVYQLELKWNKSKLDTNGFYGVASYVFATE